MTTRPKTIGPKGWKLKPGWPKPEPSSDATFQTGFIHYSVRFTGPSAEQVNDDAWRWIRDVVGKEGRAVIRYAPDAASDPDNPGTWSTIAMVSVPRPENTAQRFGELNKKERANG